MRQTGVVRTGALLIAAVLGVLLVAGGVAGWVLGGRPVSGLAPHYAAAALPASGAGEGTVLMSAGARQHPAGEAVRAQLQRHFDAINSGDYTAWATTVVPARADALPQSAFTKAYGSTRDGTIRVDRVDDLDGGRILARVRFVSTQDIADAPPDLPAPRICWRGSLPMTGDPPRIETSSGANSLRGSC